ncbi:pentapeptide repeat protein [Motilibacter rhizosphaerae]|uniref:Pentapeptide repeat protein n=1 Tax=Motilibacter rhizosphaerae TaxID=598652 RepID=A0A4Q7NX36_9ACTN|nr:pentapeptide repeat-containing protein [Motilibacter rhizosphaerae]RZS91774.1 pentapeptide repeat protein [Motilibacter rhizosphaerae]
MDGAPLDARTALLRADCASCTGLCCVVPAFAASADFAIDKPAGTPCPHLALDSRCRIHDELPQRGFPGCTAFDCLGAGQRVTARFAPRSWRDAPDEVAAAFEEARGLHELLWYVADALARPLPVELRVGLATTYAALDAAVDAGEPAGPWFPRVDPLLRRASDAVRTAWPAARQLRRADLAGADLRGADLRGADLRGALLLGADLTGARLADADLVGADLRGARLAGADLRGALFLTPVQVAAAVGDARTLLPEHLARPGRWRG